MLGNRMLDSIERKSRSLLPTTHFLARLTVNFDSGDKGRGVGDSKLGTSTVSRSVHSKDGNLVGRSDGGHGELTHFLDSVERRSLEELVDLIETERHGSGQDTEPKVAAQKGRVHGATRRKIFVKIFFAREPDNFSKFAIFRFRM